MNTKGVFVNKILSCFMLLALTVSVKAQDRFELGGGVGTTNAIQGDQFKSQSSSARSESYWLGYGFDQNWGAELGLDKYVFDTRTGGAVSSRHQALNLMGVYRFVPTSFIHPIAKFGISSVESKNSADLKVTSFGGKLAGGLEADWKYISAGALVAYHYISKTDDTANLKDSQAIIPSIFVAIHNGLDADDEDDVKSPSTAPVATAAAAPVAKKDTDNDGVFDEDDKCPNTPAGVVVNAIGCAVTEKASVRLNVEFASGKSDLNGKYSSEIETLASFMKRFPSTQVEIAGHTDGVGAVKTNTVLSQKRADSVKAALVKAGVEDSRVTAKGYGSSQPIADNKTKAGRDQNRRVTAEISVTTDKKK
jgi:OmpA-OmpF porin, OOP family